MVWEKKGEGGPERAMKNFGGEHLCILIIVMASWMYTDAEANQIARMVC